MWRCGQCETYNDDQSRSCIICGSSREYGKRSENENYSETQQTFLGQDVKVHDETREEHRREDVHKKPRRKIRTVFLCLIIALPIVLIGALICIYAGNTSVLIADGPLEYKDGSDVTIIEEVVIPYEDVVSMQFPVPVDEPLIFAYEDGAIG